MSKKTLKQQKDELVQIGARLFELRLKTRGVRPVTMSVKEWAGLHQEINTLYNRRRVLQYHIEKAERAKAEAQL